MNNSKEENSSESSSIKNKITDGVKKIKSKPVLGFIIVLVLVVVGFFLYKKFSKSGSESYSIKTKSNGSKDSDLTAQINQVIKKIKKIQG